MDEDEDLGEEETDYKKICKDIIRTLSEIRDNLGAFDKFKLLDYQKKDLIEIKEDLIEITEKIGNLKSSEYNNQLFLKIMDISCQVEDLFREIITPEFKELPNYNQNLTKMSKLIQKIMDKYLNYYKEE